LNDLSDFFFFLINSVSKSAGLCLYARKNNPAEGLNLLVEAMEEVVNEEKAV
jgi:hypothetical protein